MQSNFIGIGVFYAIELDPYYLFIKSPMVYVPKLDNHILLLGKNIFFNQHFITILQEFVDFLLH